MTAHRQAVKPETQGHINDMCIYAPRLPCALS